MQNTRDDGKKLECANRLKNELERGKKESLHQIRYEDVLETEMMQVNGTNVLFSSILKFLLN